MPAVSGSPSQQATSVTFVAELESVDVTQFKDGDLAFVAATNTLYELQKTSVTPRDGTTSLYTRQSNPAYFSPAATGRWLLVVVASVYFNPSVYVEGGTGGGGAIILPLALSSILTVPAPLVMPASGFLDVDVSWAATNGGNLTALVSIVVQANVNGAGYVQLGSGGSSATIVSNASQGGALTDRLPVNLGDSVVLDVFGVSTANGPAINAATTFNHLHLRARFFSQ